MRPRTRRSLRWLLVAVPVAGLTYLAVSLLLSPAVTVVVGAGILLAFAATAAALLVADWAAR